MLKRILMGIVMLMVFQTSLQASASAPTKEEITKLYVASFNRAPDTGGLQYWVDLKLTLKEIATYFFDSTEMQETYPPSSTTEDFVEAVYLNLFNRESDAAGLAYWIKEIDLGHITRADLILFAIDTDSDNDATIMNNKKDIGLAFAEAGLDDIWSAICVMARITDDVATVTTSTETIIQLQEGGECSIDYTLQEYEDAGITWVSAPYLDELNDKVIRLSLNNVTDRKKIQVIVYTINRPPEGMLKKTGQIQSYNKNGHVVSDDSIKDDGLYQKGLATSYTRDNIKEIVTDHFTGLMWQDNEEVATINKPWIWKTNDYFDTYGDTATTYCTDLILGGYGDWRLPTIQELQSIVLYTRNEPSLDIATFKNYRTDREPYWTSTTGTINYDSEAFAISFYAGEIQNQHKTNEDNMHVRCVRGEQ